MSKSCCFLIIILCFICVTGCSSNPINTEINSNVDGKSDLPVSDEMRNASGRIPLGFWTANFDTSSPKVEIEPDRLLFVHYNITSLVPPPGIAVNSYDPVTFIMDVEVTFSNPYRIDVYDVRLIVFTDNIGHKLLNADSWTAIFDIPEGFPINPFKAFAKDKPQRKFAGQTQNGVNLTIYLPSGNPTVRFALDASFPSNCEEPYEISGFTQGVIYDEIGSSTNIEVNVLDWQNDVSNVTLYCPEIQGIFTPLNQITTEKWGMTLVNNTGAPEGNYFGYFIARSPNPYGYNLYNEVTITVTSRSHEPFAWARTWGGGGRDKSSAISLDSLENIYVTGYFQHSVDFDPGAGIDYHTSNGDSDVYLCKYDPDGNFIWARTWGGISDDQSMDMDFKPSTVIGEGDIFVTGYFSDSVDFDPGAGVDIHNSSGRRDIFLVKYDQDGTYNWTLKWGGSDDDLAYTLDIYSSHIYIAGVFRGTVDFDPTSGVDWHTSNGDKDAFMLKLDIDRTYYWTLTWGGSGDDSVYDISIDNSGNSFVAGSFEWTVDLDPGPEEDIRVADWWDAYVSKFDSNGDFQWARNWGDGYMGWGTNVVASDDGYIYTGGSNCWIDFCVLFLKKLDTNSSQLWTKSIWDSSSSAVIVEKMENVYLLGATGDEYTPHYGFWRQYSCSGEFLWARVWGESMFCNAMVINSLGNFYVTGSFSNHIDFDLGPEEDRHYSHGSSDTYLMKYYF